MKTEEIKVGGVYFALVSGQVVQVRVTNIRKESRGTVWDVLNLKTSRKLTFTSVQRFRSEVGGEHGRPPSSPTSAPAPSVVAAPAVRTGPVRSSGGYSAARPATQEDLDACQRAADNDGWTGGATDQDEAVRADMDSDLCGLFVGKTGRCRRKVGHTGPCLETDEYAVKADAAVRADMEPVTPVVKPNPAVAPKGGLAEHLRARQAVPQPVAPAALPSKDPKTGTGLPHLIIVARAGTGKTTTLVEGLKVMQGRGSVFTPSLQQQAIWRELCKSSGARSVCFVAFNSSIASELKTRVPPGCDARTMHSLGLTAVRRAFPFLDPRASTNAYRVNEIIARLCGGVDPRDLKRENPVLVDGTRKLVNLCKVNLLGRCPRTGRVDPTLITEEDLDELVRHYEVDLSEATDSVRERIYQMVPRVLDCCMDVNADRQIDFDDMVWLPTALNLPVWCNDLLLVDEAQDLNRAQQALARKAGRRLVLCGDPRQAIYGFAGADAESMPRMEEELKATPAGCVVLPLTVTRRCGKAIVKAANTIVEDFEAHESNSAGLVSESLYPSRPKGDEEGDSSIPVEKTYLPLVQDGDMVLCRVNAPLVSQCFRFLRMGRKANIQGRDVGAGLVSTIEKLKAGSVEELVQKVDDWAHRETEKENKRRNPSENKLIAIRDRADCIICFTEGQTTVEGVIERINAVFTDEKNAPGIRLSSVHKAKGLEARRVFILLPKGGGMPHPMARSEWQREQEMNLLYVAITRAIEELVYVRQRS